MGCHCMDYIAVSENRATAEDFSVVGFKPVTDASSGSRRKASLSSLLARAAWDDNQE